MSLFRLLSRLRFPLQPSVSCSTAPTPSPPNLTASLALLFSSQSHPPAIDDTVELLDEVVELLDDVEVAMAQGLGDDGAVDIEREDAREALVELEREVQNISQAGNGGMWAIRQLQHDTRRARQRFDLLERRYADRWGIADASDSSKR